MSAEHFKQKIQHEMLYNILNPEGEAYKFTRKSFLIQRTLTSIIVIQLHAYSFQILRQYPYNQNILAYRHNHFQRIDSKSQSLHIGLQPL